MNLILRTCGTVVGSALMVAAMVATPSAKDAYPADTVTLIVPYAAGGAGDTVGRIVASELGKRFAATFVVENVGGGGGSIGAERAARAAADGSTLLLAGNAIITTAPHLASVGFDPLRDLTAVANVSEAPRVLVASKTLPVKTFEEFVAYGKKHPGELNYGTVGVGSTGHIATVDMLRAIGVDANHIPYPGAAQVVQAVLSGDIEFMLDAAAIAQVKQDAVTPLAVPGNERLSELPDVPTLAELGYASIRGTGLQMVMAPAATPADVLGALEAALKNASESAEFNDLLSRAGVKARFMGRNELNQALSQEYQHYETLLADMGLKK
ncbi:Bug family tripartite tricarboxylate transporter substrate binding protein [Chelatococcus asaccharovorans]|uniref:Tripartite-type tricarboxylate transporter receptor subunit TctC n=1 Tax=Chelatococcus asaccharovorans TaxID=28210 RepID=A0A2V3TX26_9HYPH|nr:tripartite tricarboxylate transporter substrate binding protein [Chelatococcus asaccharovorans]MBS7705035.1 tripartite tricarboxylate transporter substrate binding protein [Chelatococcus asaccharovorans]PXW53525.1 tripartite-type tricarboxylate transporter receptor subunit TctC [Chelatococcus asaccharovorans]